MSQDCSPSIRPSENTRSWANTTLRMGWLQQTAFALTTSSGSIIGCRAPPQMAHKGLAVIMLTRKQQRAVAKRKEYVASYMIYRASPRGQQHGCYKESRMLLAPVELSCGLAEPILTCMSAVIVAPWTPRNAQRDL